MAFPNPYCPCGHGHRGQHRDLIFLLGFPTIPTFMPGARQHAVVPARELCWRRVPWADPRQVLTPKSPNVMIPMLIYALLVVSHHRHRGRAVLSG